MYSDISILSLFSFAVNTLYALLGLVLAGIVLRLIDTHFIKDIDTIAELKKNNTAVGIVIAGYIIGISLLLSHFLG